MTARQDDPKRHRRSAVRGRWLAAGGVVVLASVLGVALLLQTGAAPACAAPPIGSTVHRGMVTFYELESGGGNCSYPAPPADGLYVALGPTEYAQGAACGGYLNVTGPKGTVRVKIVDQCPGCEPGHLDLSRAAFARIADLAKGNVPVTYRAAINAPVPGPLTFRIKEGASRYWFAVLVDNHANPLRSVEVKGPGGTWRRPVRHSYNYWIVEGGLGPGPFTIRVTDVYGRQATAPGITMSPGVTQRTAIRMSASSAASARSPKPTPSRASRSPKPSASVAPTVAPAVAPTVQLASPTPAALAAAERCG